MRVNSAATSGEAPEVSDSMTSLTRVQSLSADRAFNRGNLSAFDPSIKRSPRKKKKDRFTYEEILNGKVEPFSRNQISLMDIPPRQPKEIKALEHGGGLQTAIEIEDDEEEDPISDPSSPRGSDHVVGWLSSPDRGLSRDSPTVALRKARMSQSPTVSLKQLNFESNSKERSISSSVIELRGDQSPSKRPAATASPSTTRQLSKTPTSKTSSIPQAPLTPNNLLSTSIEFDAFEWDITQSASKARGPGPLAGASPIEAWKQQVAAESSPAQSLSTSRVLYRVSEDSEIQVVEPHAGVKRGRDETERVKPRPKKRKPIETEAFPLDLPEEPISDRQKQRDIANNLLSSQAKAFLVTHDESQEVGENSLEEFHAVKASQPQIALRGRDAINYCEFRPIPRFMRNALIDCSIVNTGNAFIDRNKRCKFCNGPLPKDPTPYLTKLFEGFASRQREEVSWQQSIEYCRRHRAEVGTFPLGIQAGYPATLNSREVAERVLSDKMSKHLIRLVIEAPCSSAAFKTCSEEISAALNLGKWRESVGTIRKIPG